MGGVEVEEANGKKKERLIELQREGVEKILPPA
jgi:hypothetical protein